jgi:hypothetical protein
MTARCVQNTMLGLENQAVNYRTLKLQVKVLSLPNNPHIRFSADFIS